MRNFNDLTWKEIEAIGNEAVAAIEKAILTELQTGNSRDLLGGDNARDLIAEVGDVIIRFRPAIPTDWVSDGVRQDFTAEEIEAMTDAERHAAEWDVVQKLVAQSIDNGLPRRIWDDLCDRANERGYDLYDVLAAYHPIELEIFRQATALRCANGVVIVPEVARTEEPGNQPSIPLSCQRTRIVRGDHRLRTLEGTLA